MATTIQVEKETAEKLRRIMAEVGASTYDELIGRLLVEHKTVKRSRFGKYRKLPRFRREEIDRLA
jgi:hypothetical protein